jgi:predicted transposase YdaD
MLERIAESPVDEVVKFLLVNVIETYFVLSKDDTEKYLRLLARKENRAVQDLELTWADKLMEKGRQAGVIEGKRETLSRQLRVKFGPLPEDVMNRIAAIGTLAELDTYLDRIPTAKSLVEIGLVE